MTHEVEVTLSILKAGDGTRRSGELLEHAIRQAEAERDKARAALDRVRALHRAEPSYRRKVCAVCFDAREEQYEWPCPTIRALDGGEQP